MYAGRITYYILNRPSALGMGSDSDNCLVTEENLHKIMSEAEIARGLKECTTYDGVPDIIRLPGDIPVSVEQLNMKDVIFRVHNQWLYERDIIVGEATFNRHFVDLSEFDGKLGRWFREKTVYEFTDFDFRHVAENHFFLFYKAEDLIETEKIKIERLSELGRDPKIDKHLDEARATIRKFENLPVMEDEYYKHFYHQKYLKHRDFFNDHIKEEIARDAVDHTLCAYDYPLLTDDFACEVRRDEDPSLSLTYGELFHKGTDIRHLVADRIGSRENLDGFAEPQMDLALLTVFGYD